MMPRQGRYPPLGVRAALHDAGDEPAGRRPTLRSAAPQAPHESSLLIYLRCLFRGVSFRCRHGPRAP